MGGLLRSVVKTAAVAGTATATRNVVNRRQAQKNVEAYSEAQDAAAMEHAQRVQAAAPVPQSAASAPAAPAAASQEDVISQLERLGALKAQGILTEDEFQAQKAKLLGM